MKIGENKFMPELPDVEVFKRYLDSTSLHKTIKKVEVKDKKILEKTTAKKIKSKIEGKKFNDSKRHGKYLFINLEKKLSLMLHFGMTGFLKYFKNMDDESGHSRILFTFDNGYYLSYDCQRLLGKVRLIENISDIIKEKNLGPDALSIDIHFFKDIFENKRGGIKSALMNQKNIAGIGNIYSDEILFQTGIHPKAKVNNFDEILIKELYTKMKNVLNTAIEKNANPDNFPKNFVIPQRKKDGKCPIDGVALKKIRVNGRETYFCPKHQEKL